MSLAEQNVDLCAVMNDLGRKARQAASILATADSALKNSALQEMAAAIRASEKAILAANEKDLAMARQSGQTEAFIDRLLLDDARIEAMAAGLENISRLPDPVGEVIGHWQQPNGIDFSRVRVPIGVIGIIYESRPNVTADAGALCMKAGNAAILRGGSGNFHSSSAIADCLGNGLEKAGLPRSAIQLVPSSDRAAVGAMLAGLDGQIDLIVPRGGRSLVERVQRDARVPVFAHLDGICHVYIDKAADQDMAVAVTVNAKMRRTGICGAAEAVLIDRAGGEKLLRPVVEALLDAGCEVRGDDDVQQVDKRVVKATADDWGQEFLSPIIAVRLVNGVEAAMNHIARYGSQHTDSIITNDQKTAERFLQEVDSAIVVHNASTQFADGGEFGFGAEIGIATGKLHARGPVALEQLTTFKYQLRGQGQIRP